MAGAQTPSDLWRPPIPQQGESVVVEGHARWGEGFLLVFSLTDRASFTSLPALHASLAAFRATPHFPCVIVANKTDLGT